MDHCCYAWFCGRCSWYLSEDEKIALDVDQTINRILLKQKKKDRRERKLLLLGTGESGKTTFIKQMHIIHKDGYSEEEERKPFAKLVYQNIFTSMQSLTGAMETLNILYEDQGNRECARLVQDVDVHNVVSLETAYVKTIRRLWADPGIQACYKRRREYQILDSANYYLSHLDRIADDGYVPTKEDILKIRMPTTGINEYCFSMNKTDLRIVDVGGQKSERRKWIHAFQNVNSLMFLASLSEYDQRLEENNKENRMRESLALFNNILRLPYWKETNSIILFLNKTDILEEKICISDLKDYFPHFTGPRRDSEAAKEFILKMYTDVFEKCTQDESTKKETSNWTFYHHYTCATDTDNIRKVFDDLKEALLIKTLRDFVLL
ncbi:guanine nucleotide-binding protein subunit alpha-15-like [Lissotriton helveticus]